MMVLIPAMVESKKGGYVMIVSCKGMRQLLPEFDPRSGEDARLL
jgi:hypothetical protein